MKIFLKCLKANLSSPLTYTAIILLAVFCGFGATVVIDKEFYSFFDLISDAELLAAAGDEADSFVMAYHFSDSAWYPVAFAIISAVPPLYIYIKCFEKIHNYSLIRSSYKGYSAGMVLSSFVSGVIIILAGVMIYAAAAYLLLPSVESARLDMYYGDATDRVLSMTEKVIDHALAGGIVSAFVIMLYRYIRSDFLAATIPMMLMYVSIKVLPNYREWFSSDMERMENVFLNFFGALIFPSNLTDLSISFKLSGFPFWLGYVILAAFLFVIYILFYKSVRRV